MKNSTILGLISLLALSAVGTLSNVAPPALAAEKYAEDKINKIYEICDKLTGKRTVAVSLDSVPVCPIEFGTIAKGFMHERSSVVDVFRAENMTEFMNQGNHIR